METDGSLAFGKLGRYGCIGRLENEYDLFLGF